MNEVDQQPRMLFGAMLGEATCMGFLRTTQGLVPREKAKKPLQGLGRFQARMSLRGQKMEGVFFLKSLKKMIDTYLSIKY